MSKMPAMPGWDELPEDEKNYWRGKKLPTGSACTKCGRPADVDPNDHTSAEGTQGCYHCSGCGAQVDSERRWHPVATLGGIMALIDDSIDALIDRTDELLDQAAAAWNHHPDKTLGALAGDFVAELSREDLQALAVQCIVDYLVPEDDDPDLSDHSHMILN